MPTQATGKEACKSWGPGRGWQVSEGPTGNLLSCVWPLRELLNGHSWQEGRQAS